MRTITKYLFILSILCLSGSLAGQNLDTIRIDLGSADNTTTGNWNNLSAQRTGNIPDLLSITGLTTGISLAVTDAFNGVNTNGLTADDSLNIPITASGDSFFGNVTEFSGAIEPTGGITLSNLDLSVPYSFSIFASRSETDNRETKYVVTGSNTAEASINVTSNSSNAALINNIFPAPDGTITIIASPGENNDNSYGFFYMGVVQIFFENNYIPPPKSIILTAPNGGEIWEIGKTPVIRWISSSVSAVDLEYSQDSGTNWLSIATGIPAADQKYSWMIASTASTECIVRILDNEDSAIADSSDMVFSIIEDDGIDYEIVVLGSSTAAGTGPSSSDSAWVWMYREYLQQGTTNFNVTNLAVGGFTTYKILPTGVSSMADSEHNITKALSYYPDAIIINLPSNDAASNFPVVDQIANYDTIAKLAEAFLTPLWVCTPQPRNFEAAKDQIQLDMVDSTHAMFGDKTIDFWTGMFEDDETNDINDLYDSGDGVHLNNAGHKVLLQRVIGADIDSYVANRAPGYFNVTPELLTLELEIGSNGIFNVITDLDWTVSTDALWLGLDTSSGSRNREVEATVIALPTGDEIKLDAEITFSPTGLDDFVVNASSFISNITSEFLSTDVKIFPNPVGDLLHIESDEGVSQINIFDINGRQIMNLSQPQASMELDVSQLPKGIYVLKAYTNHGISIIKLVK
ncbi:GDSL-type esterase/lipase family protein [Bacteroidota bacterium]